MRRDTPATFFGRVRCSEIEGERQCGVLQHVWLFVEPGDEEPPAL